MADDWTNDPTTKRWIQQVLDDMVPKLEGSAIVMQLVPNDREGDVKFWVELGASIMYDKPILAVAFNDQPIPRKLELVADEVVRLPRGVNPEGADEIAEAIARMLPGDE